MQNSSPPPLDIIADNNDDSQLDSFTDLLAEIPDILNDHESFADIAIGDDVLHELESFQEDDFAASFLQLDRADSSSEDDADIHFPSVFDWNTQKCKRKAAPSDNEPQNKKQRRESHVSQDDLRLPGALEDRLVDVVDCDDGEFQNFDDLLNSELCTGSNACEKAQDVANHPKILALKAVESSKSSPVIASGASKLPKLPKKSRKRKSRKAKVKAPPLAEQRRTKWRRGTNDLKMKRAICQVREHGRSIRAVSEEEGINERALRRYVHISMDPRRQNSGYYMVCRPGEKVPKCLRNIV